MRKRDNRSDQQGTLFGRSLNIPPRLRLSLSRATPLCDLMSSSPLWTPRSTIHYSPHFFRKSTFIKPEGWSYTFANFLAIIPDLAMISLNIPFVSMYLFQTAEGCGLGRRNETCKGSILQGWIAAWGNTEKGLNSVPRWICKLTSTTSNRPHSGIILNILRRGTDKHLRTSLGCWASLYNCSIRNHQLPFFLTQPSEFRNKHATNARAWSRTLRNCHGKGAWTVWNWRNYGTNWSI